MRYVAYLLLFLIPSAATAGTSLGYGNGGRFVRYDPIVAAHNRSGELFRIQGHCQSACTLFLGIRNVCIERSARLLFHAGHDRRKNVTVSSTQHMMSAYNARLRRYLTAGHYMEMLSFHAISGADMIDKFGYKECPKN
jgi:hypothetical protein